MKIGITGGIGSGKTTVCGLFHKLGIPIYNADVRAKELMQSDPVLIAAITQEFGDEVYLENGNINRPLLAEIVFHNEEKLKRLNSMVHPAVFKDHQRWVDEMSSSKTKAPYTLKEAALLVETGAYKRLDKLIVVTSPLEKRIDRITTRDQSKKEDVMARVNAQFSDSKKLSFADFTIVNDGSLADLEEKVLAIHHKILKLK